MPIVQGMLSGALTHLSSAGILHREENGEGKSFFFPLFGTEGGAYAANQGPRKMGPPDIRIRYAQVQ